MDEPTEPTAPAPPTADGPPALRVVRGCPDAVELAALTAVLLARLRALEVREQQAGTPGTAPRAPWGAPARSRPRVGWTAPC
ncbi:acyl-CoA carboxylase epsilon subunit [Streptomyces sp. NEAU-W12]|uniref:acyl-CoA carboxylase epsilon subunit n=1 Tax=Streptomyces sp. NEAU-W12 TaxID=2994668 RepID=UPI00224B9CEC|nr:acyl-CoA carboxylase epsilon subunit [Streptomyces sp. NEAU-W12]MCX2923020.1 acyl-CoA carboxylase epsilon subunit [Streptomyces sp. NEAU-W12]